jgi:Na+/H+ antiporter NhaC
MIDRRRRVLWGGLAASVVWAAICAAAVWLARLRPEVSAPWYSIVPPLLAVTLALLTNRIFLSLGAAVVVGGLLGAAPEASGPAAWLWGRVGASLVYDSLAARDNQLILLYVVLIMAMIGVMLASGGLQGVAAWLMELARSARSTRLVTVAAGLLIFIDDYANTMIIGATMRPMTDRQRISREKLAFLVDATAAPVAGVAIISTWIGVEVGLLGQVAGELQLGRDGYSIFFDAIGFRFYCLGMIAFVVLSAWSGQDFGPMRRAERRAARLGKLLDDDARPMTSRSLTAAEPHPAARILACTAIVPMLLLLAAFVGTLWLAGGGLVRMRADAWALLRLSAWRDVLSAAESIPLLAMASDVGLLLALLMALALARIPLGAASRAVAAGVRSSLVPATVLVLAWSLKGACDGLGTGEFLAGILGDALPPAAMPPLVFVVASLMSFATGTSWGTMAILIPTAVPVAFQLDGAVYGPITVISVAAILDGAIFGDHCSPISDTTIMSSAASACDHMAHVRTQMPYSLLVAGIALATGYVPAALGAPNWLGIAGSICASGALLFVLWLFHRRAAAFEAEEAMQEPGDGQAATGISPQP